MICLAQLFEGVYIDQFLRWFFIFDQRQFITISFQEYSRNPYKVIGAIFDSMQIKMQHGNNRTALIGDAVPVKGNRNSQPNKLSRLSSLNKTSIEFLHKFFLPYNRLLEMLLQPMPY